MWAIFLVFILIILTQSGCMALHCSTLPCIYGVQSRSYNKQCILYAVGMQKAHCFYFGVYFNVPIKAHGPQG